MSKHMTETQSQEVAPSVVERSVDNLFTVVRQLMPGSADRDVASQASDQLAAILVLLGMTALVAVHHVDLAARLQELFHLGVNLVANAVLFTLVGVVAIPVHGTSLPGYFPAG